MLGSIRRSACHTIAALLAGVVAATPALAQKTTPDTLARIKAAHVINVAFAGDSLPFSSLNAKNEPEGYSIDLCKRVIAQVGRVTGEPALKVNWLIGTTEERLAMVAAGKADLECGNTSATQSRMKVVDFSNLVFVDGGGLMVKVDGPARFADLSGKKIAVIRGTTTEARLRAALTERRVNATVIQVRDGNEGTAMLESGGADAFAGDKIKLVGLGAQGSNPNALMLMSEDLSFEPYAFALPHSDSAFRLEVNKALSQVYQSVEIENVFAHWLGKLGRPSGLLAAMYVLNSIPE